MRLITQLLKRQKRNGWLSDDDLRAIAAEARCPLYRVQELVSFYPHFRRQPPPKFDVALCRDVSCRLANGSACAKQIRQRWENHVDVSIREVSCIGRCDHAPAALFNDAPVATSALAAAKDLSALEPPPTAVPPPLRCDPYGTSNERYGVIRDVLSDNVSTAADRIVAQLKASGLRGMGGAGFPTGTKWELVRKETRTPKYVICNADESEPGTFKDRDILRHLPHLVIEGMLLAGLVVGASRGILFIRHEYEPEQHAFEQALAAARQRGLFHDFDIEVATSPGGYILGEETALLEALEDKRGEPRNKPPFPGTHGLHGQPTLINNVETLAMVPSIVRRGADWWKGQGRPGFAGLKFMAVSGHVERPGVYEIQVGTTVQELIDLAGGVMEGKKLLAFAPGGASSAFLPASKADTPLDFAAVTRAGSMLGSGALIVVAEGTDMLDVAANVTRFFRNESCGKCVPCRLGTEAAVRHLDAAHAGRGSLDPEMIEQLAETLHQTSICGLGQVALTPLLSVMKNWPRAR